MEALMMADVYGRADGSISAKTLQNDFAKIFSSLRAMTLCVAVHSRNGKNVGGYLSNDSRAHNNLTSRDVIKHTFLMFSFSLGFSLNW